MAWIVLLISGMLEAVWAIALGCSDGFRRIQPTAVFVVALILSMSGLGYALRSIPLGTGYAVWVGVGASLTALFGMVFLGESASVIRVGSLLLVIVGIVGLKLAG